jgi:hypothetical protein
VKHLDAMCARAAQEIVVNSITDGKKPTEVENVVTKALGVVQENGIYAGLLYLYSRGPTETPVAKQARDRLLALVGELGAGQVAGRDAQTALKFLTDNVCGNLDTLLLVKQVWEQTLIYARYGAKASG